MVDIYSEDVQTAIRELIAKCIISPDSFESDLIKQMIETSLKLSQEGHDTGQLKLINRAIKEMRYAYRVFNKYKGARCVSIFGSARTPEHHPDYLMAKEFSQQMADKGWMCMTGGANGIMKAGLEGPQANSSFGLSIRLPFEVPINSVIEGDPKHIIFRLFFTRKLMFLSHSDALVAFPGGYGTLDELFESLTMMQTGKTSLVPLVLLEGKNGNYWQQWQAYVDQNLAQNGWVSPDDRHLYYRAETPEDGVRHIQNFYKRYHSSRYVKELLAIRLLKPLTEKQLAELNEKFAMLIAEGTIYATGPLEGEVDVLDLPRIAFHHTRLQFGLLRALIDQINVY